MYRKTSIFVVLALTAWTAQAQSYVTIGNPGNTADGGFGSVDYVYRIGVTEVSIAQYQASGVGGGDFWSGVDANDAPVANITWHQAAAYCNWLTLQSGNTTMPYQFGGGSTVTGLMTRAEILADGGQFYLMPTEDEWYKAAYYKPVNDGTYSVYANGTSVAPSNGFNAAYAINPNGIGFDAANIVWTINEGTLEQNFTKNMMGNVFEWLETPKEPPLDLLDAQDMAFRGGGARWQGGTGDPSNDRLHSGYRASGVFNNQVNPDVGMRIVSIPEPGTLSMMGLNTLGLFAARTLRRRKRAGLSLIPVGREYLCDTYCSRDEWAAANQVSEEDSLDITVQLILSKLAFLWSRAQAGYKYLDEKFWDSMVKSHERRMVRKKNLKTAVKKKALNGFDAFLALIMK